LWDWLSLALLVLRRNMVSLLLLIVIPRRRGWILSCGKGRVALMRLREILSLNILDLSMLVDVMLDWTCNLLGNGLGVMVMLGNDSVIGKHSYLLPRL
jgi:hypothetical protein